MSEQHTPGRVTFKEDGDANHWSMLTEDGRWWISLLANGEQTSARQIANFRRLAACWNACDGIETHALELMTGDLAIKEQITASGKSKPRPATFRAVVYRRQRDELLSVCKQVIEENLHLADGEVCTLAKLKQAIAKAEGNT